MADKKGADPGRARARFRRAFLEGARQGVHGAAWLARFMVPVSLAVAVFDRLGVLGRVAGILEPAFRLLGLPGEASVVFLTGALLNLYSALAALAPLALDSRQVTILALAMLVAHNLPVETIVQHKAGTPGRGLLALRVLAGLGAAFCLNLVLPAGAALPPAASLPPPAAPAAGTLEFLAGWLVKTFFFTLRITLIVTGLMILQRLLEEFRVLPKIARLLRPLMRLLGLPAEAAFLWTVANTLGLAYGAAAIIRESRSGRLAPDQVDDVNRSVAVCHSLLEDTLLFVAVGAWPFWITVPRLLLAALVTRIFRHGRRPSGKPKTGAERPPARD